MNKGALFLDAINSAHINGKGSDAMAMKDLHHSRSLFSSILILAMLLLHCLIVLAKIITLIHKHMSTFMKKY